MHRICTALVDMGFDVTLVGRQLADSPSLPDYPFRTIRLVCRYTSGPLFYYYFNQQLYDYLINNQADLIYAVDLDTLWAGGRAARKLGSSLIFDAHEYFTEVPELSGHSIKRSIWSILGRRYIPMTKEAITVNDSLATVLGKKYSRPFSVIRNVPIKRSLMRKFTPSFKLIYQGVLNKGRCIEQYIDMMPQLNNTISLHLYGTGDIQQELMARAEQSTARDRIVFYGRRDPSELSLATQEAWLGLNLLESDSLNYYYSLANKFFDYMHAGVPSINSDLPEYRSIISAISCGKAIDNAALVDTIQHLYDHPEEVVPMQEKALLARDKYNWSIESEKLKKIMQEYL